MAGREASYNAEQLKNRAPAVALEEILRPLGLRFRNIDNQNYAIFPEEEQEKTAGAGGAEVSLTPQDARQDGQISGRVEDMAHAPVPYATVALFSSADSTHLATRLTDESGYYLFKGVPYGTYFLQVSYVGYDKAASPVVSLSHGKRGAAIGVLQLKERTASLQEVVVEGRKPLIEQETDRYVMHVENSALASGNAVQLLKAAPFVEVSPENEVTLQGKKTMILVDNKPVAAAALAEVLQTLPAGTVSQVELITNPSARYDAAYGAVINIVTRKDQAQGLTATLRTEASQGDFGRLNVNGRLTYKHRGLTLFGMGGYNRFNFQTHDRLDRLLRAELPGGLVEEEITRTFYQDIYSFQAGANLQVGRNQQMGVLVEGQQNQTEGTFVSYDRFSTMGLPVDSVLLTDSPFSNKPHHLNYHLYYSLLGDSANSELYVLATYTPVRRELQQYFPSALLGQGNDTLRIPQPYRTTNSYAFDIWVAQADYSYALGKSWQLEAGLKHQATDSRQVIDFEAEEGGRLSRQAGSSSNNHLAEAITGGYGILSKNWEQDRLQLGVRLEHTKMRYVGHYEQDYLQAFPTLRYRRLFGEAGELAFSYRRTINRVPYDELVPYTLYINHYTVFEGNPSLKPQYDHIFSLNTRLSQLGINITFTSSEGRFAQFPIRQDFETRVTYAALQNLESASDLAVDVSYPLQLTSWWSTENSGTVFGWSSARGRVLGESFSASGAWCAFRSLHAFKLHPSVTLELNGSYRSARKAELTYTGSNGNVNLGLLVQLLKGKGQLRVGAEEVLGQNSYYTSQNFGVYRTQRHRSFDSQRLTVGLTFNLGQAKVKAPVPKLGNEEAVDRL